MSGNDRQVGGGPGPPRRRRVLSTRLMLTYSLLVAGIFLLAGVLVVGLNYQYMAEGTTVRQRGIANTAAAWVAAYLDRAARDLELTAAILGRQPPRERQATLDDFLACCPAFAEVVLLDGRGAELAHCMQPAADSWWAQTNWPRSPELAHGRQGRAYRGAVSMASAPAMNLAVPVEDARLGDASVLVARLSLQPICETVARLDLGPQEYTYVADECGLILACSHVALVGQRRQVDPADQAWISYEGLVGELVVGAATAVPGTAWTLAVEQPANATYGQLKYMTVFVVELLLAGLYLVLAVSWWLGRRLVRPIRALQEGAAIVGAGNLDHVVELRTGDELENLAESFNDMVRNLAAFVVMRGQFVNILSHELRAPLTNLRGILEWIRDGDGGAAQQMMEVALWETDRMRRLVDNLMEWSAPAGLLPLNRMPIDLADLVSRLLEGFQATAQGRGIALHVHLPPAVPPVMADPDRLAQVLSNLVQNALQYTLAGGQVKVCVEVREIEVCIAVQDTGIGILPEDRARIFEAFQRGGQPAPNGGVGLGLAISRRIVEQHGGRIWVESTPGEGSTFAFTIPFLDTHRTKLVKGRLQREGEAMSVLVQRMAAPGG